MNLHAAFVIVPGYHFPQCFATTPFSVISTDPLCSCLNKCTTETSLSSSKLIATYDGNPWRCWGSTGWNDDFLVRFLIFARLANSESDFPFSKVPTRGKRFDFETFFVFVYFLLSVRIFAEREKFFYIFLLISIFSVSFFIKKWSKLWMKTCQIFFWKLWVAYL